MLELFSTAVLIVTCFCFYNGSAQLCFVQNTCGDCIRTPSCVWCNSTGFQTSRCIVRSESSSLGCTSVIDPRSGATASYTSMVTDSIYTATPSVTLRIGEPVTVKINIVPQPNTPLDLYILMDLSDSMLEPLNIVVNASKLVAQQVSSITTNVRIGFGSFNDKPVFPFSQLTPTGCPPGVVGASCAALLANDLTTQYSFFHRVNFTSNFSLPTLVTTKNLDLPESSFDALVQSVACEQQLGWRSRTAEGPDRGLQRLVLLVTDDQPHLAGDGRFASIYQANDGKCHLRPFTSSVAYYPNVVGEQIYSEDSLLYDYPSLGQVASILKTYDVIPIFAIVPRTKVTPPDNFLPTYQAMQDFFTSAGVRAFARPLLAGGTNLLSVISTVYQEVVQKITLALPTQSDIDISLTAVSCPSGASTDGSTCSNVALNQTAQFTVRLTLKSCNTSSPSMLTFLVPGFGSTNISVTKMCDCQCASEVKVNATDCNYHGNVTCAECMCSTGWTGTACNQSLCNKDCLNGGTCQSTTGLCACLPISLNASGFSNDSSSGILPAQYIPSYSGENCTCKNFMCPINQLTKLICSGRGYCGCECACDTTQYGWKWGGDACNCPGSIGDCYDVTSNLQVLCSGQGTCSCNSSGIGSCSCYSGYTGNYCKDRIPTSPLPPCSDTIGNCVIQYLDNTMLAASCQQFVINSTNSVQESSQFCLFQSGDCVYTYSIVSSNGIQAIKTPVCQVAVWKIIVMVVGGLLFIFIVICIVVKIVIIALNYAELKQWERELKEIDFAKNQNPLYQNPETLYTNVAYGTST